jgi:hypothetical protein
MAQPGPVTVRPASSAPRPPGPAPARSIRLSRAQWPGRIRTPEPMAAGRASCVREWTWPGPTRQCAASGPARGVRAQLSPPPAEHGPGCGPRLPGPGSPPVPGGSKRRLRPPPPWAPGECCAPRRRSISPDCGLSGSGAPGLRRPGPAATSRPPSRHPHGPPAAPPGLPERRPLRRRRPPHRPRWPAARRGATGRAQAATERLRTHSRGMRDGRGDSLRRPPPYTHSGRHDALSPCRTMPPGPGARRLAARPPPDP